MGIIIKNQQRFNKLDGIRQIIEDKESLVVEQMIEKATKEPKEKLTEELKKFGYLLNEIEIEIIIKTK